MGLVHWLILAALVGAGVSLFLVRLPGKHAAAHEPEPDPLADIADEATRLAATALMRRLATGEEYIVQGLHGERYAIGAPPWYWERANSGAVGALKDRSLITNMPTAPARWVLSAQGRAWRDTLSHIGRGSRR